MLAGRRAPARRHPGGRVAVRVTPRPATESDPETPVTRYGAAAGIRAGLLPSRARSRGRRLPSSAWRAAAWSRAAPGRPSLPGAGRVPRARAPADLRGPLRAGRRAAQADQGGPCRLTARIPERTIVAEPHHYTAALRPPTGSGPGDASDAPASELKRPRRRVRRRRGPLLAPRRLGRAQRRPSSPRRGGPVPAVKAPKGRGGRGGLPVGGLPAPGAACQPPPRRLAAPAGPGQSPSQRGLGSPAVRAAARLSARAHPPPSRQRPAGASCLCCRDQPEVPPGPAPL